MSDKEVLDELFDIGNLTDEQYRTVKRLRAEVVRLRAAHAAHTGNEWCPICDPDMVTSDKPRSIGHPPILDTAAPGWPDVDTLASDKPR